MPDTSISANILAKCTPAMSVDASRVDGMTLVNIEPTVSGDLDTIYRDSANSQWRIIGELLEPDFRGKACEAKVNGLADWIKGTARVIDSKKITMSNLRSDLIDVRPFLEMEVENPINNHYWNFTAGSAPAGGEKTPNTNEDFDWKGVVASQKSIPGDVRWFGRRSVVTVIGKDVSTSGRVSTSYKVLDAKVIGGSLTIYLVNISAVAADPLYLFDNTHYKRSNIVYGILMRGLPNVTTAEAYCDNIPGLNPTQLKPFWIQQTRRSVKEDSQYLKYVQLIRENNPLFKQFGDVDSVRYNKQVTMDWDNRLVNTFFYNGALANQTTAAYGDLELVPWFVGDARSNTYSFDGRYQCRRANALGYFEQLAECDDADGNPSLIDMLGTKLDLVSIHRKLYLIKRVRSARGQDARVIELWMDSLFREKLVAAYLAYFKAKGDSMLQINMNVESNSLGFTWHTIKLDYPAVELRLVSHDALDDMVEAAKAAGVAGGLNDSDSNAYKALGSVLFAPDWSATYRGLLDAGNVVLETGTPQDIAKVDHSMLCGPLVVPTQRVKHYYETFTNVIECGSSQAAWENFDPTGVDQS